MPRAPSRPRSRIVVVFAFLFFGVLPGPIAALQDGPPEAPADPEVRALFEEANDLWTRSGRTWAEAERSADLLREVTERDPDFVLGQVYLAQSEAWIHQQRDRSDERADIALEAATTALELAPDRADTHAAMAAVQYRIFKDYDAALRHFGHARERDPEDIYSARMMGYVSRRAGEWDQAIALLEEVEAIDATRASEWELGNAYKWAGRYDEARKAFERARGLAPDHNQPKAALAWLDVDESGDFETVRSFLDETEGGYVGNRWYLAMVDEDWDAALAALEQPGSDPLQGQYGVSPRALLRALVFERMGDEGRAEAAYEEARETLEPMVEARPDDPRPHLALGLALAGLGETEAAVQHGQRGVAAMSTERDYMTGTHGLYQLAEIQALAGQEEEALATLRQFLEGPRPYGNPNIAVDPWLYSLQGNAEFEALLGTS